MLIPIKDILQELLVERTRLLLTILAVAWGTIAIASMLAVGEGLRVSFNQAVSGAGKGLLYMQGGRTSNPVTGIGTQVEVKLNHYDYLAVQHLPSIKYVYQEFSIFKTLRYQDKTYALTINSATPSYSYLRNIIPTANGRFINTLDMQQHNHVIVLGNEVADNLFAANENPVGKSILVGDIPFTVIGVMKNKLQLFNRGMPDKYSAWIPQSTFKDFSNTFIIPTLLIIPKNPLDIDLIKKHILTVVALNHQVNATDPEIVNFTDSATLQQKTDSVFFGIQIFLGLVGLLTLIVAGAGIANVMYASVAKSTRDIGVRMAIGARSEQILAHYITESLLATSIGGGIGFLGTLGFIKLLNLAVHAQHTQLFQELGYPHPILSFNVMLIVIVILGVTGLLAGFFPARKAAYLNPVEALRYE